MSEAIAFALGICALVGAIYGGWKWALPRWRKMRERLTAGLDSIVGREAVKDSITQEVKIPALPGIGVRMAHVERNQSDTTKQLAVIVNAVTELASQQRVLDDHAASIRGIQSEQVAQAATQASQAERIKRLEEAAAERIVARQESALGWRAMEAAIKATPDAEPDPDELDG